MPERLYVVLAEPALLAGMPHPQSSFPWTQIRAAGFRHVICLTDSKPSYDPTPLEFAYPGALQDLVSGGTPRDPSREEELIREAAKAAMSKPGEGEGVLIHCAGGTGRTGTVLACVLCGLGFQAERVIEYLNVLNKEGRGRRGWPESPWQAQVVRRFSP
jgi:Tyrosine phosphatase family